MLKINVSTAEAVVTETELITAGRKGLRCAFTFSEDWAGLAKTVIVQGAATRDIALLATNEIVVPAECVDKAQFPLKIGVYGALPDGTIAIPTIWASFGKVLPGAKPSLIPPDELTPDVVAQVIEASSNALYLARNVQSMADSGELDGDAATISVGTTTTLPAGSPATVENIGTSSEAVFNFGIPKGDKGNTGATGPQGHGVSDDLRAALVQLASKVAYIDDQGATYYQELYDALYNPPDVVSISAVFNQGTTEVYSDTPLDDLKPMLTVFALYNDNTTEVATNYTLTGTLDSATSTVTVSYLGKTTTFNVAVTILSSISAVFTQSGTVYDTDTLDSLKDDLVVTAHYSDSSTQTVPAADYTLSGTLTAGTSTITVSYGGKTTTFSVTVTAQILPSAYQQVEWIANPAKAYILPDFSLPASFRIEAKTQLQGYNEGGAYGNIAAVFQANATTYGMELAYKKEDSTIIFFMGAQSIVTPASTSDELIVGGICNGTTAKCYVDVNGTKTYGGEVSVSREYTTKKLGFFYAGEQQSNVNQLVGKLFYCKVFDLSDNLLADFVPCYRKSDGVIGVYDTVNETFSANAGYSTLTKGSDV